MSQPPVQHSIDAPAAPPPTVKPIKQTERPHPLTPFIRGWIVLLAIMIGAAREVVPDGSGEGGISLSDLSWILPFTALAVLLGAIAGFVSWYFTRFVIDDEELRVETGAVFKSSKKVPFERLQSVDIIQPLAARLFGLAELRLEAGAGDSTIKLRYLRQTKATSLREYLLTRAHGERAQVGDHARLRASVFTDLTAADRPLVQVGPDRLILSFLLSTEWLLTIVIAFVILVITAFFDMVALALPALIPLAISAVTMISRRLIAMFNFTLAESPRGMRVTRGLTNLTSQSVPIDRIQGVKISQPLTWRPLRWYRVDVDIVGYAHSDTENNESTASSVLLPVADADQVELAVGRVLPGFDLDGIELNRVPSRARWIRWFDFWTLRYGWNDRAITTEEGWLNHERNIVPHAKTQSVRIEQGPLQRLLRLADVHIDTPKGPVHAVAHHLDAGVARELTITQLDRARAARRADRERIPVAQASAEADGEAELLASFGTSRDQLLGSGGESEVFAIDEQRVLRIYRRAHDPSDKTVEQIRQLLASWEDANIGLEVPKVISLGQHDGRFYTVDRRFSGRCLSPWLAQAQIGERREALSNYLDATRRLRQLPSPIPGFARLVGQQAPQQFSSLGHLLHHMLEGPVRISRGQLERDLPNVAQVWDRLHADLTERVVTPALVHGDVCPANTYIDCRSERWVISGIGDFSPHTVNGDPMMDIAGAVIFLELEPYPEAAADSAWLEASEVQRAGAEVSHWIEVYRRFYGFYFSDAFRFDPVLYAWCLRQLRR
ncbi:MAG TPA: PH domain-containing protein [Propionibacteriaceae bacterium]|jgi:putative membrane protein|nr:PH domain-containing protein [Propionibacteriaceae bacterium]